MARKKQFPAVPSRKSVQEVASIIQEEGEAKGFMSLMRRALVPLYAFAPTADDDPFASSRPAPAFRVGYSTEKTVTNKLNMSKDFGWALIFDVCETATGSEVSGSLRGNAAVREGEKFFERVTKRL